MNRYGQKTVMPINLCDNPHLLKLNFDSHLLISDGMLMSKGMRSEAANLQSS